MIDNIFLSGEMAFYPKKICATVKFNPCTVSWDSEPWYRCPNCGHEFHKGFFAQCSDPGRALMINSNMKCFIKNGSRTHNYADRVNVQDCDEPGYDFFQNNNQKDIVKTITTITTRTEQITTKIVITKASEADSETIWQKCDKLATDKDYFIPFILRDNITYWCEFIKAEEGFCQKHGKDAYRITKRYSHYGIPTLSIYTLTCGCPDVEQVRDFLCKDTFYQ